MSKKKKGKGQPPPSGTYTGPMVIFEHVSEKDVARWDRQRWKEDGVDRLPDGFSLKPHGRNGSVYYRADGRVLELYCELAGAPEIDVLVNWDGLNAWIWPERSETTSEDRVRIRNLAEEWFKTRRIRAIGFRDDPPAKE